MEREAFRQRMQQYKQARENNPQLKYWDWKKENDLGYQLYKNNLPSNLQVETDSYDLYGAYESNMQPELNEDGTYHLGSRDPYTGRILKSKQHPTYQKAIESEISAGYFPYEKNNITYTKTYSPVDISGYADGGTIYKKSTEMSPNELWLNVLQHENYNSYLPFSERIDVLDKIQQHDAVIDKYRNYSKKVEANPEVAKIVYKPLPKTLEKRWELAEEYKIPFISDKQIKLSKGRFNTGITSENVLDSIYNSANRTGVSFRDAIGLAGRESGLGYARNFKNKGYITGSDLYSNWGQIETIYNTNSAVDRYKKLLSDYDKGIKISEQDVEFMNKFRNNAEKEYESLRPLNENPIDNALKLFQSGKYNPGDPRHTKMVQNDGDVLLTDPAIKSWAKKRGIKLYSTGGTVDEDPPSTSERPITNFDPKGDPYNPTYGYNPGAGYVRSVFDLYDAPVIGDALSIYDATQALKNKDWLGAGLAALTVVPFIPTVSNYKKSLNQQLNRITGITPDISKLQKQSDWNDLRNRSIERLYDPEVRARAAKIKSDYNVDLQSTYDKIINQYENDYFSLPEAEIVQLQDAKAMLDLQEEAARRYKQYGIKPTQKDFRIKVDNAVTPNQEITNHEINHFNQYIHQDNPSWNKSELNKITKQFDGKLRDKNPIDPQNTSYFMNRMEQNAYGINMLDRLKELNIKPTKQNILKYLKSLPDTDSIKKAALQFKNLDDYIKWLNTMPLADNGNINETENYNFA